MAARIHIGQMSLSAKWRVHEMLQQAKINKDMATDV